ncbi:MAG: ATP-binding protein, partial [Pseudomonadota bacterium]
ADTGADTVDQDWIDIGEALAERRPFRDFRFLIKHANGDLHHMSSSGVPVFDAEGAYQGYRGIATDRTELVESEKERQRLADDLNQAQKLRAIGQLTGGVAHDFNNLLAVVMGNLELAEEHRPEEAIAERIRYAKEATERGAALTHRLLAYARQQPLAPQPIDAAEIISGLDDLLRRTLGEKVEIEFVINAGTWRCMADQQQLETAILNLAVNARDAMPNGGKLTIEAFNSRLDAEYAEQGPEITPGQYVCFAVTDTGTGMSPDVVDQAFDPFFTTKEAGQGSGLGLSMAFGFVKQSNGHIKIYSEEDSGTTVKIYLPRTEGSVTGDPRRSTTADSTVLTGRKVLVVEDELEVRNVVVAQLERFGCVVQAAATSEQAIELCEKDADFELLLVDVVLPGPLDGRELSIALGTLVPGAKIVFMSGYTENSIVHNGKLDEGVLLLQKPFSRADLVAMLIRALRNGQ